MDCWQILGIEPTDDERAIKRAYAKQLKNTRPDDDAAAYQQLREAFDYALAVAPHIRNRANRLFRRHIRHCPCLEKRQRRRKNRREAV